METGNEVSVIAADLWEHLSYEAVVQTGEGEKADSFIIKRFAAIYFKIGCEYAKSNPNATQSKIKSYMIRASESNAADPYRRAAALLTDEDWNKLAKRVMKVPAKRAKHQAMLQARMKCKGAEYEAKAIKLIAEKYGKEIHPYNQHFPFWNENEVHNVGLMLECDKEIVVTLFEDKILDGKNMLLAADWANIKVVFVEYEGNNPFMFVFRQNIHRRHLKDSQRAMIAALIVNTHRGSNQHVSIDGCSETVSQNKAAAYAGVSVSSVARAIKVRDSGNQGIINDVLYGIQSVDGALKLLGIQAKPENKKPEWLQDHDAAIAAFTTLGFDADFATGAVNVLKNAGIKDILAFIRGSVSESLLPLLKRGA